MARFLRDYSCGTSDPAMDRTRDVPADRVGALARREVELLNGQARHGAAAIPLARQAALREHARKLALERVAHGGALQRRHRETVEDQPLDVQIDVHFFASTGSSQRNVASSIGFSSARNSVRAASRTSGMVTGEPVCAARKAALSTILLMLPPARLSLARRAKSTPSSGTCGGNILRQIAWRSAGPGNGKFTTKRRRRRNALSSADF